MKNEELLDKLIRPPDVEENTPSPLEAEEANVAELHQKVVDRLEETKRRDARQRAEMAARKRQVVAQLVGCLNSLLNECVSDLKQRSSKQLSSNS